MRTTVPSTSRARTALGLALGIGLAATLAACGDTSGADEAAIASPEEWCEVALQVDDVVGDVVDLYDPAARRGVTLSINSSAGGYQSQGDDRHVHFGIDAAQEVEWIDCGRPNPTSNYVGNSLTVFDGHLYAATTDAQD